MRHVDKQVVGINGRSVIISVESSAVLLGSRVCVIYGCKLLNNELFYG